MPERTPEKLLERVRELYGPDGWYKLGKSHEIWHRVAKDALLPLLEATVAQEKLAVHLRAPCVRCLRGERCGEGRALFEAHKAASATALAAVDAALGEVK